MPDYQEIAVRLFYRVVRMWVNEFGSWSYLNELPDDIKQAGEELGVSPEEAREAFYLDIYGPDREYWPD